MAIKTTKNTEQIKSFNRKMREENVAAGKKMKIVSKNGYL